MRRPVVELLCAILAATLCRAEDTCQDVNLIVDRWKDSLDLLRGCPGIQGPPGLTGPFGEDGEKGDVGIPGQSGSTGDRGDSGEDGSPGYVGPPGIHGPFGLSGFSGLPGLRGDAFEGVKDCVDLKEQGVTLTGWYYIFPDGNPLRVMCDMENDGGGWIVFQRRADGSVDFNRDWDSYKRGFGNQWSEFWLGNDNIHALTSTGNFDLRVDLEDFESNHTYAVYKKFSLGGESVQYTLYVGAYESGNAGNSLSLHNNQKFSTFDKDNDKSNRVNCAVFYSAPWWHQACFDSSLNGEYLQGQHTKKGGITWSTFKSIQYSLKFTEMKFRRAEEEK